jgi:hypothetical protein
MNRFLHTTMMLMALCLAMPAAGAAEKVKVLALVDDSVPLGFHYQTRGREVTSNIITVFGGILPWAIDDQLAKSTLEKNSVTFRKTIGEFDRRRVLEAALTAATPHIAPLFEMTSPAPGRHKDYLRRGKPDFGELKRDGWKYLLVVTDSFSGMASSQFGSVATYARVQYAVYDVGRQKQMSNGDVARVGPAVHGFDSAISDRKIFLSEYPLVAASISTGILGAMNKNDVFYAIGRAEGLGDKVYPIGKILDSYARRFDYSFDLPSGWKKQKYDSKYRTDIGPTADWQSVGDGFSIDLLIDAFGNNVKTLPEYRSIFLARLVGAGFPVDTVRPFTGLNLGPSWDVFIITRPDRVGREIVAMRMVADVVFVHDFVFVRDYEANFAKYRADIEHLVNKGRYTVDGRS